MTTCYNPGTTAFRHNASPRQKAAQGAKEFTQSVRINLAPVIANWQGNADQHHVNMAFAALAQAALQLLPYVTEAVAAVPGSPYGNELEIAVLNALQGIKAG